MLTPEVQEEVLVLLSAELERLKMIPSANGKLVLGRCRDGLILIFPAMGTDGAERMNLIRVYEPALRSTRSEVLIKYFEDNRATCKQSIEEFALSFTSGWNQRAGKTN
jgi:hypothetical protein